MSHEAPTDPDVTGQHAAVRFSFDQSAEICLSEHLSHNASHQPRGNIMNRTRIAAVVASTGLVLTGAVAITSPVEAHTTGIHDNCTNFNQKYPHGVGRRGAVDKGGDVTNFKRSNRKYDRAERHNSDLDRDDDRIACEKA